MGMVLRYIKLLTLFFLLPSVAQADEPVIPIDFKGSYEFAFSGIPFGRMNIDLNQTATKYAIESDIAITGLAKLFVQHESHTETSGTGKNFIYPQSSYEANYSTRKKPKYAKLVQKGGVFVSEKVTPPDNPAIRPPVSAQDKKGAFNPLFLAISIRGELASCLKKEGCKSFSQKYYDGRRLTQVDFELVREKNIRIDGTKYPTYQLAVRRTTLAGYTEKELKRISNNDPVVSLYMSHDSRLIPLLIEAPLPFGTASATLKM